MANTPKAEKLSYEQFCLRAIEKLKRENYKGIHSVYSGFNNAFKQYYGPDVNVIEVTKQLDKEGKITITPARGGVMLYKVGDVTKSAADKALTTMGL